MGTRVVKSPEEYRAAIAALQGKVTRVAESMTQISVMALFNACIQVLSDAAMLAPIDTGNLRSGGYLKVNGELLVETVDGAPHILGEPYVPAGSVVTIALGFEALSDRGFDYAPIQHWRTDFNHPRGGQAKYLEVAWDNWAPEFPRIVRAAIAEGVRNA